MFTEKNAHCYSFEEITYPAGFMDASVDATYIIHLENNGRLEHIWEQLKKYQPTKTVYLVHNQGFKHCEKELLEQIAYHDITDAFLQCFRHANEMDFGNILILEDDFIFREDIQNPKHIQSIDAFLHSKKEEAFIYYLSCNPLLVLPGSWDFAHYKCIRAWSMHSVIYSKKVRQTAFQIQYGHWDKIVQIDVPNRYMYRIPLCYQTYPLTENRQMWSQTDSYFNAFAKNAGITLFRLDRSPEPGFTINYVSAKAMWLVLLVLLILVLVFPISLGTRLNSASDSYSQISRII
jgi:hypothetical protein